MRSGARSATDRAPQWAMTASISAPNAASTPRTPFLLESARIPTFNHIPVWGFFVAGIVVLLLGLYNRRESLRQDMRYAIRPVVYAILTVVGGLFLAWVGARGALHLGLVIMIGAVWFALSV